MSGTIFGQVDLNKNNISYNTGANMLKELSMYKFDNKSMISNKNICMGCGILYVTEENKCEQLPFFDRDNHIYITADAILDNREELIQKLDLYDEHNKITDSEIILAAYKKWKEECVKYLLGDFSFVIFNTQKNELFCATDCTGSRTLYYKLKDNVFSFATLIECIHEEEEYNEKWISDFLALPVVMHHYDGEHTIYDDIYEVPPSTFMIVNTDGIQKIKYWDPVKDSKKLKFNSDEECVEQFKEIFNKAVKCRLRTDSNIAISMSGGIDSTSIACVASDMLKDKKLISFTSVPMDSYKKSNNDFEIVDETEFVEKVKEKYKNIEVNYCKCEGENSLDNMDLINKILEQPYKTFQNNFWCMEIMKKAEERNCRVLLSGQFGNFTISYGDFFTNMKTLLHDKRYIEFIKEIIGCSKLHDISKLFTLKTVLKNIRHNKYNIEEILFNDSPINENLITKYNIKNRFHDKGFIVKEQQCNDMYYERKFMTLESNFIQIATIETKLALYNGLIERDPTKDKRIIEFCFGLDGSQYVRNGLDRYLIRRAMDGIIPEKIRMLQGVKASQAADWVDRLKTKKQTICSLLKKSIENTECKKYLNISYIKKQLELLQNYSLNDYKYIDIRSILISINLYKYFVMNKGGIKNEKVE